MSSPSATQFDPFLAVPYLKSLSRARLWPLLLIAPTICGLLLVVSWFHGTLGSFHDFQPLKDTQSALGIPDSDVSAPTFPLLRDFASLFLIIVIGVTIAIVQRQWIRMVAVVPALVSSGSLRPRVTPCYSPMHKRMRVEALVARGGGSNDMESLLFQINTWLKTFGRSSAWVLAAAAISSLLLALGSYRNGVFPAFAGEITGEALHSWTQSAYDSWWASISYPAGWLLYLMLMALGVFLVIVQNFVGLISVYALNALTAVAEFDLDWLNRDGNYGWASVSSTFGTVVLSLVLHGSAMSITLLALGIQNLPWAIGVVAIWTIMLPSVTLGPKFAFRGLNEGARARRIDAVLTEFRAQPHHGLGAEEELRRNIESIREVRARPLRVRLVQLPAFVLLVLLPILLTVAQIYFSIAYAP